MDGININNFMRLCVKAYSAARGTVNTQTFFGHFYDIFLTSLMLGNWQLANQEADNSCKAE